MRGLSQARRVGRPSAGRHRQGIRCAAHPAGQLCLPLQQHAAAHLAVDVLLELELFLQRLQPVLGIHTAQHLILQLLLGLVTGAFQLWKERGCRCLLPGASLAWPPAPPTSTPQSQPTGDGCRGP